MPFVPVQVARKPVGCSRTKFARLKRASNVENFPCKTCFGWAAAENVQWSPAEPVRITGVQIVTGEGKPPGLLCSAVVTSRAASRCFLPA